MALIQYSNPNAMQTVTRNSIFTNVAFDEARGDVWWEDMTEQQHPVVAGANGYFVAAWETPDPTSGMGSIAARFVGEATGFGYNSVSGQNDEFIATDVATAGGSASFRLTPSILTTPVCGS